MFRLKSLSLAAVLLLIIECSSQFILPTYRPPHTTPRIYRVRRGAEEPQWLFKGDDVPRAPATGDHPYLPPHIDDIKRHARSVDSPSARRHGGGGGHSTSGSRDTGPTHPGYNRRNARSLHLGPYSPTIPKPIPIFPKPLDPNPRPLGKPLYIARGKRDLQFPQKPKYHEVVFTGWNPNAKVEPWQKAKIREDIPVFNSDRVYVDIIYFAN